MSLSKRQKLRHSETERVTFLKSKNEECLPIKTLEDLKNWKPLLRKHATAPLQERVPIKKLSKTLVCHDMRGGYLEDRFLNGSNTEDNFYFLHWAVIDIFVYFSHHFITIPPCSWISAAHKNGVKILGTFITEWDDGIKICEEFFKDENVVDEFSTRLSNLAEFYNFDGWLINIENKLQACQIPFVKTFVKMLTEKMHACKRGSQVIWYDSVIETGDLKWQNALNEHNRIFFDCCDGIFLNYSWTEKTLLQSVNLAGERKSDVFVGVDVFGRGCPGGFCTDFSVTTAKKFDLSVAIFAPGWLHECLEIKDFKQNQFKFWNTLQKLCPPRIIKKLPFNSSFCPGFGKKMFRMGKIVSEEPWFNISLQAQQPIYYSDHCSDETSISICNDDAFNGGGCLCLIGNANREAEITFPTVGLKEILSFKVLRTSFLVKDNIIISYTHKALTPNVTVALVLHMNSSVECYDLHLVSKKDKSGDSTSSYLLPESNNEIEENSSTIIGNSENEHNWIKRLHIIRSTQYDNQIIEGISITVTALQNEASCVLLGELQVVQPIARINFTYRDLKCEKIDEEHTIIQCTLEWEYHPAVCYSDLFLLTDDEKEHIARTSQCYYDLEMKVKPPVVLEIKLSLHTYGREFFYAAGVKIPVNLLQNRLLNDK